MHVIPPSPLQVGDASPHPPALSTPLLYCIIFYGTIFDKEFPVFDASTGPQGRKDDTRFRGTDRIQSVNKIHVFKSSSLCAVISLYAYFALISSESE